MKNNHLATIVLLLLSSTVLAQNKFSWSVANQGMSVLYRSVIALSDGSSIALINKNQVSYSSYPSLFKNNQGGTYQLPELVENTDGHMIVCFDSSGSISWAKTVYEYEGKVLGMVKGNNDEILCVILAYRQNIRHNRVNRIPDNNSNEPAMRFRDLPNARLKAGINVVTLSPKGYAVKSVHVQHMSEVNEMEFDGCAFHPNGSIILHGFIEGNTLASNLRPTSFSGGGDFILAISQSGTPLWGDIVHYRDPSCCTRTSEGSAVSVAPDGSVYLAGSYFNGGIFSTGLLTLTPHKYTAKQRDWAEVFVVRYTAEGDIKWIKTAEAESRLHSMSADNQGITLGLFSPNSVLFDLKTDPALEKPLYTHVVRLTSNGNPKWIKSTQFQRIHQIRNLTNGSQVCVGSYKLGFRENKRLDRIKIPDKDDLVVYEIDAKGSIRNFWSASLLLSRETIQLCPVDTPKNTLLIAFETWCALSLDLKKVDSSLPDVKCYGGTQIIGKIQFPNN